jgi:hypothetical protein
MSRKSRWVIGHISSLTVERNTSPIRLTYYSLKSTMTEKLTTKGNNLITKMPDEETLEAFVCGLHGPVRVAFNFITGEFEWVVPRPDPMLGQPKTEEGRRIQRL